MEANDFGSEKAQGPRFDRIKCGSDRSQQPSQMIITVNSVYFIIHSPITYKLCFNRVFLQVRKLMICPRGENYAFVQKRLIKIVLKTLMPFTSFFVFHIFFHIFLFCTFASVIYRIIS